MKEIWKPIKNPNYSDIFRVSNFGNVKRIKKFNKWSSGGTKCDILLKPYENHKGYLSVWLIANGARKSVFVHRLVALAFIDNPNNYPQVNHIDGNKKNNCVQNLEWCTSKQNIKHAMDNGLFMANLKTRPVYQFSLDGNLIREWKSGMDASRFLDVKECLIYECCNGNYSSAYGFVWSYQPYFNPKPLKIQRHHRSGVIQYDSEMNEISRFPSIKQAAQQTGTNKSQISLCCSHKKQTANGYIWEYA